MPSPTIRARAALRPLAELRPSPLNPRRHPATQVAKLAGAIERFGFVAPILIRADGEIVAGEARWLAAREAGYDRVAVVEVDLDETEAAAYRVADNRLAEDAVWDEAALAGLLADLRTLDFGPAVLGFDAAQIAALLPSLDDVSIGLPALPVGPKGDFEQMTFTLHVAQAAVVREAMAAAAAAGPCDGPNKNRNGNALARVAAGYLGRAA